MSDHGLTNILPRFVLALERRQSSWAAKCPGCRDARVSWPSVYTHTKARGRTCWARLGRGEVPTPCPREVIERDTANHIALCGKVALLANDRAKALSATHTVKAVDDIGAEPDHSEGG